MTAKLSRAVLLLALATWSVAAQAKTTLTITNQGRHAKFTSTTSGLVCAPTEGQARLCPGSPWCFGSEDDFFELDNPWLLRFLRDGVYCKIKDALEPVSVSFGPLEIPDDAAPAADATGSYTLQSEGYFGVVGAVLARMKQPACGFRPEAKTPADCSISVDPAVNRMTFAMGGAPYQATAITIFEKTDRTRKPLVTIPVGMCRFAAASDDAIYAGAAAQRLAVRAVNDSGVCIERLARETTVHLVEGTRTLPVKIPQEGAGKSANATKPDGAELKGLRAEQTPPPARVELTLENVPDDLAAQAHQWQVKYPSGGVFGTLDLPARTPPASVVVDAQKHPQIDVSYREGGTQLDQWHSGVAVDGKAVVTFLRGVEPGAAMMHCTGKDSSSCAPASPEECPSAGTSGCVLSKGPRAFVENVVHVTPNDGAPLAGVHMVLRDATWASDLRWLTQAGPMLGTSPLSVPSLGPVRFAVTAPQHGPLDATLELYRDKTLFYSKRVRLAEAAGYESLPLPLGSALYVECGEGLARSSPGDSIPTPDEVLQATDIVPNGKTRAVNDTDVETGSCRLRYAPAEIWKRLERDGTTGNAAEKAVDWRDTLALFGRQEIVVRVSRAGAAEQQVDWSLDPTADASTEGYMRLPALKEASHSTGVYTVTASLRAAVPPSVHYRPGTTAKDTTSDVPPALGDLEFTANLRPRGPFGWQSAPIRMFVTFPVNATGIRFPARSATLRASSDSTFVQTVPVSAGILFALEPWNYDTGRNNWAIPTRFVTGFHLYDLSAGNFAPAWVTGVSVTLPLVDLPKGVTEDQIGADVAVSALWEVDMKEPSPFERGNHFLLTFGLNLLSLFGSK